MPTVGTIALSPISASDLRPVGEFLHAHLNSRLTADAWAAAFDQPWQVNEPNHGYLLRDGADIVGAYLAFYSEREIEARTERFCNLAAWCVLDDYRSHGLRLLRALLSQKGYHFTDLSPSGNVVPLNERLKFVRLEAATMLVPNLPWPPWSGRSRIVSEPREIEGLLRGRDLAIYRDHARAAAARHAVVTRGDETCHVVFRRDSRKRLPIFATILHVSNRALFAETAPHFFRYLLLRHGIPLTFAERRVTGELAVPGVAVAARPRMYRSANLRPDQIDYLYSELTCVAW